MTFENITFKHTNIKTNHSLDDYATTKLVTLQKYLGSETDLHCAVEFEKIAPKKSGQIWRVEVNIWVGGTLYRAEATEDNFEAAINVVRDELDVTLKRATSKQNSLWLRGRRMIKEKLLFGSR